MFTHTRAYARRDLKPRRAARDYITVAFPTYLLIASINTHFTYWPGDAVARSHLLHYAAVSVIKPVLLAASIHT